MSFSYSGPPQLPVFGNLYQLAIYGRGLPIYEYFELLGKKYGKIFRFQAGVTLQGEYTNTVNTEQPLIPISLSVPSFMSTD